MSAEEDEEYVEYVTVALSRLRRSAYLLCGDAHRADDIVQSALVTVYLQWSKIRRVENLDGYVHRILVRRYLDEARRSWAKVLLSWRMPEMPSRTGPSVEDASAVRSALAVLSRGQRSVLVLRFFCDMSVQETATVLGCSTGSVKSQTSRALTTMRRLLGEQWPGVDQRRLEEARRV
ncbi:RNA polymerase sigma-70 factor, sigma-E family [Micromonospora citrea]|uniref:RNA polymerase sigma-70 factor, sigma-E family n=1 Tax=Micromonospora citrea TaxID=47855 RepID=A0A1C6TSK0_9ACTN|nr:SigE family RNA polymerase sigma factor [Micromonospora citrea]SCL44760.1 RNA polymerase sigma-70 factor, sigma-E family [Micromonospora citrea]